MFNVTSIKLMSHFLFLCFFRMWSCLTPFHLSSSPSWKDSYSEMSPKDWGVWDGGKSNAPSSRLDVWNTALPFFMFLLFFCILFVVNYTNSNKNIVWCLLSGWSGCLKAFRLGRRACWELFAARSELLTPAGHLLYCSKWWWLIKYILLYL